MPNQWRYQVMGVIIGPLSRAEMRDRVLRGEINHDTLVSKVDMESWVTADRVSGLLSPATPEEIARNKGHDGGALANSLHTSQAIFTAGAPAQLQTSKQMLTPGELRLLRKVFVCIVVVYAGIAITGTLVRQNDPPQSGYRVIESTTPSSSRTTPSSSTSFNSEDDRLRGHQRVIIDGLRNNTDSRTVQESLHKVDRDHGVDPNRRYP